jgi:hypothetical protein
MLRDRGLTLPSSPTSGQLPTYLPAHDPGAAQQLAEGRTTQDTHA